MLSFSERLRQGDSSSPQPDLQIAIAIFYTTAVAYFEMSHLQSLEGQKVAFGFLDPPVL